MVHHRRRRDQPRVGAAGGRVVAALGAQHTRLLLRLADVEHPLVPGPLAQVLLRAVVLALAPTERHDVDAVVVSETLDGVDETLRDRRHQHRRRHAAAPDRAEEIRRARRPLQHRHVDVEVQPVDALERQRRVLRQDLGDGSCYLHGSGSGRWAPTGQSMANAALCDYERGFAPQREQRPESDRPSADTETSMLVGLRRSLARFLERPGSLQLSQVQVLIVVSSLP